MNTIMLFLMSVAPEGYVIQQGYSGFQFKDLPECHQFVTDFANGKDTINYLSWNVDFSFQMFVEDGSFIIGKCELEEEK